MNRRRASPQSSGQLALDGLFYPPPRAIPAAVGCLDVGMRIRETLALVLHDAADPVSGERLDRFAVAAAISRLTGRDHTKNMLDRYTAPSAEDWRFPLEILPALVKVTGDRRLLELMAELCEARVVVGEEVIDAELGRTRREIQQLKDKEAALMKARRR